MTAVLQVCVGCRAADPERRRAELGGGEALAVRAREIAAAHPPGALRVDTFPCLGGCRRRGRLSLAGPGRWAWLFAGLDPERDGDALARFVAAWLLAPDGLVPKPERPAALRTRVLGRVLPPDGHAPLLAGRARVDPPDPRDAPDPPPIQRRTTP